MGDQGELGTNEVDETLGREEDLPQAINRCKTALTQCVPRQEIIALQS